MIWRNMMECPYCNKEIAVTSAFCPECGQSISEKQKSVTSENYWSTIENDDKRRNQEYQKAATKQKSEAKARKAKTLAVVISLIVLMVVGVITAFGIISKHNAELEMVKANLPGMELECSYSQLEGGFWFHYYYYTLKFKSDETLDYYYLTTAGPADKDDIPEFKGTYTYSIKRNLLGEYYISFENEAFTMKVSADNVPISLSYGK